jgi:hypothetical protein
MWTGKIPKGHVNSGFLFELSLKPCWQGSLIFQRNLAGGVADES